MNREVLGRDAELKAIDAFVRNLAEGARALVFRGEPGIGKTVLWLAATNRLSEAGALVLSCRPSEAEVRFAYGALRDLLVPVIDRIAEIPAPLGRALRVALLVEEAGDRPIEAGAVESAALALLRMLSAERPLAIAVDDAQWIDAGTRGALVYALRRLGDEPVGLLASERVEEPESRSAWMGDLLPPGRLDEVALPPMSLGAIHRLVHSRLGISVARPRLLRLHEVVRGNPYYALEIASAWEHEPDGTPVPETLRGLIGRRLRRLPPLTRRVLLVLALAGGGEADHSRIAETLAMTGSQVADALEPARAARVVSGGAANPRFAHPLLAATTVEEAAPADVARAHERLARTSSGMEERARHLSLARVPPQAEVAAALDEAAAFAGARGAATDAAELRSLALRFTPDGDPHVDRRLVDFGEATFIAGDVAQAIGHLAAAIDRLRDPPIRIEALLLLATVMWYEGRPDAATYAERALAEAGDDRELLARIHARMSWLSDTDVPKARHHAEEALRLLHAEREPALYAFALLNLAHYRLQLGEAADHDAIQRGFEMQERASIWEFSTLPGNWPKAMDDFSTARSRLEMYLERVRTLGDESSIAQILGYLSELECWTGHLGRAREEADEAIELAEETGQRGYLVQGLRHRALAGIVGGDLDGGRRDADRALELAEELGDPVLLPGALGVRALVDLTDGDLAAVDRRCTRATELLDGIGMRDHAYYRFQADHIEALIGLGRLEAAEMRLDRHTARGSLGPRPWIQATAARCHALLQAARGDLEAALASAAAARLLHQELDMPFELGRTLLVEGQIARRANRRRESVAALERAIEQFEVLGSSHWADKARMELARVGIRRGRTDELTPTELSVAKMAAGGLTNREVASALYISPKTVEANLARAYSKLGIRSRAELGAVMADHADR